MMAEAVENNTDHENNTLSTATKDAVAEGMVSLLRLAVEEVDARVIAVR